MQNFYPVMLTGKTCSLFICLLPAYIVLNPYSVLFISVKYHLLHYLFLN